MNNGNLYDAKCYRIIIVKAKTAASARKAINSRYPDLVCSSVKKRTTSFTPTPVPRNGKRRRGGLIHRIDRGLSRKIGRLMR